MSSESGCWEFGTKCPSQEKEKLIAHYFNDDQLKNIETYQKKLRHELRTEKGLVKHLNRIIDKRRKRREEERKILMTMRSLSLTTLERKLFYSYIMKDEIEWFDIFRIPNDACILEVGRRNAGKTFGTNWLLYTKRKVFPFVFVFTMTKFNGAWAEHVHEDCIFKGWKEDAVLEIKDRQERAKLTPEWGIDPRAAVVLDDMAADKNLRWNPSLLEFSFYGRHLILFVLVTTQWYKQLATGFRENCDILFIYKMDNQNEIEALWKEHSAGIPKNIFYALVQKYSTDTTALVIVKNGMTPLTKFYQYRAMDPGPFRLGCDSVWEADDEES